MMLVSDIVVLPATTIYGLSHPVSPCDRTTLGGTQIRTVPCELAGSLLTNEVVLLVSLLVGCSTCTVALSPFRGKL